MPLNDFLSGLVDLSDCEIVSDNARVPDAAVIRRASLSSSMRSSITIMTDDLSSSMRSYLCEDDDDAGAGGYHSTSCPVLSNHYEDGGQPSSAMGSKHHSLHHQGINHNKGGGGDNKNKDVGIEMIGAIQKLSIRAAMEHTRRSRSLNSSSNGGGSIISQPR